MKRALLLLLVVAPTASADDDLATQGEALAKAGDYSRAIDAFKAADKQHPSTRNVCMIGLAYLRREAWPQAELFLATCKERAATGDPAPDWLPSAEQQLAEKLAAANVATVAIDVVPVANARVTVSSFALDESFTAPRTLHLAPGRHTFEIHADGYELATRTITISDRQPQTVHVELVPVAAVPAPRKPVPAPAPEPAASHTPYVVMGAGAVLGAGALIYGLAVVRPMQSRLSETTDRAYYEAERDRFLPRRDATFVVGGAAILTIAAGAILHFASGGAESRTQVGVVLDHGGGMLTLAFDR